MSWEGSHTQEAYDNAERNLELLDYKTLQTIWSEIKTYQTLIQQENIVRKQVEEDSVEKTGELFSDFDITMYDRFFEYSKTLDIEKIIEDIWQFMKVHRECTNGGFEAYTTLYNISFS
jgi:hypothetical protein